MLPTSKFHTVAIGGTFDRLHKGHRFFISQAFILGSRVIIGITSDEYAAEKCKAQSAKCKVVEIKKFIERKRELVEFLTKEKLLEKAEILAINDVYGPAITDRRIEAIVVTRETLTGARAINRVRRKKGLAVLHVVKVPLVLAEDRKRIASSRIRFGEIDRWGKVFRKLPLFGKKIPLSLRVALKKPLGTLIIGNPENPSSIAKELKNTITKAQTPCIITVGDEVTKLINGIGVKAQIQIFDFCVGRVKKYQSLEDLGIEKNQVTTYHVSNPPGMISDRLLRAVVRGMTMISATDRKIAIQVLGEEDLAGLPAILLAPLGTLILYGQPGEGVVVVEAEERKKQAIVEMMEKTT